MILKNNQFLVFDCENCSCYPTWKPTSLLYINKEANDKVLQNFGITWLVMPMLFLLYSICYVLPSTLGHARTQDCHHLCVTVWCVGVWWCTTYAILTTFFFLLVFYACDLGTNISLLHCQLVYHKVKKMITQYHCFVLNTLVYVGVLRCCTNFYNSFISSSYFFYFFFLSYERL